MLPRDAATTTEPAFASSCSRLVEWTDTQWDGVRPTMASVVAFDESGNTGDNLLDEIQPIYSLASVCIPERAVEALLARVGGETEGELKYSELRATKAGRELVLKLLGAEAMTNQMARITPMHKPFTTAARYFDYLMETTLHEAGFDVYGSGAHIQFANILYRQGPAACGGDRWRALMEAFVAACRSPTDARLDSYVYAHLECRRAARDEYVSRLLDLVPLSQDGLRSRIGLDQGQGIGVRDQLDPAVTSLLENCMRWAERVGRMVVRHDDASVVQRWKTKLELLASPGAQTEVGDFWAARMPLPLDIERIELVRSEDFRQVQLADVLAGASVTWLGQFAGRPEPSAFIAALGATMLPSLIENEVWPLPLVDGYRF